MILVRRTYTPKAGAGGKLAGLVRQASEAMSDAGFRKPRIFRTHTGLHGTLVVDQEWESIAEYQSSRDAVRATPGITGIFDQIYPLLQSTHYTEILVEA